MVVYEGAEKEVTWACLLGMKLKLLQKVDKQLTGANAPILSSWPS